MLIRPKDTSGAISSGHTPDAAVLEAHPASDHGASKMISDHGASKMIHLFLWPRRKKSQRKKNIKKKGKRAYSCPSTEAYVMEERRRERATWKQRATWSFPGAPRGAWAAAVFPFKIVTLTPKPSPSLLHTTTFSRIPRCVRRASWLSSGPDAS